MNQSQKRIDKNVLLSYDNKSKSSQNDNIERNEGTSADRKTKIDDKLDRKQSKDKIIKKKLNNNLNSENLINFEQEPTNSSFDIENTVDQENIKLSKQYLIN